MNEWMDEKKYLTVVLEYWHCLRAPTCKAIFHLHRAGVGDLTT